MILNQYNPIEINNNWNTIYITFFIIIIYFIFFGKSFIKILSISDELDSLN